MNLLAAEDISKSYGTKALFSGLNLGVNSGDKVGLIGVNGTGKSTLLKILMGIEPPDSGRIIHATNARIGYLQQNPVFKERSTVIQAALQGNSPQMQLVREYESALAEAEAAPDDHKIRARLATLGERMDEAGLWQMESQAKMVLTKLGISDFSAVVDTLSGGERKRIALAAALINPVDLLILDEPTNQIDADTVAWLETFLKERQEALLMVTHDRYFLDRVTNRIVELDRGQLYSYSGNYSLFLEKKAEREEQEQATAAKRQNLFRRELAWIRRGAKARSTKQQARIDRFQKLETEITTTGPAREMEITAGASRLGKKVVILEQLGKSWDGRPIITDLDYTFLPGDRVGIIGPNGVGKSTLLRLIAGMIQPDTGRVEIGSTVKFGFFTQEALKGDESQRVIDYLKEQAEYLAIADGQRISASQMLERFLFSPDMQWTPIAKLSGGEKRRLFLLRVLMTAPNVLLLDEPTNDLDTQTLGILEEYLDGYPGVVITVSHDRYFLDRVVEKLIALEPDGSIRHFTGNYSDFLEERFEKSGLSSSGKNRELPAPEPKLPEKTAHPKPQLKLSYKEQRELDGIEAVIDATEGRLARVRERIAQAGSDYQALQELIREEQDTDHELQELMNRWVYLNELAAEVARNKSSKTNSGS
ncbi:MAG TPA: ABC-F family ATP-binding cassette domain-containing protein [Bacillota bacterium]